MTIQTAPTTGWPGTVFHPATHILIALEITFFAVALPTVQGTALLTAWFILAVALPSRTDFPLAVQFLKILAVGALFLVIMHGIHWRPPSIRGEGLVLALDNLRRIAAPIACVVYLSRRIRSEELFALLIDYGVPPEAILILFRTLWLVPRLNERIDEVLTAQKMRGMPVRTMLQRTRALLPTLNPIFSSMLNEIAINSLVMTARGFIAPGVKTHLVRLRYRWTDAALIICATFALGVLWF